MKAQSIKLLGAVCAALIFGVLFSECCDLDSLKPEKGDEIDVV